MSPRDMSHDEFHHEPVRGLPGKLPEGEEILWQGAPEWRALARRAFLSRLVVLWFACLMGWSVAEAVAGTAPVGEVLASVAMQAVACAAAVGLLALIAYAQAKTTVYTITSRRVVMRFGVAIDLSVNLPFSKIESAALKLFPDGTGNLPLVIAGNDKLAYLHLWPNARPWHLSKPQPMLRAVADARKVAGILAAALEADKTGRETAIMPRQAPDARPVRLPRPSLAGALHAAE